MRFRDKIWNQFDEIVSACKNLSGLWLIHQIYYAFKLNYQKAQARDT